VVEFVDPLGVQACTAALRAGPRVASGDLRQPVAPVRGDEVRGVGRAN
jgi:hypothetical protein